MNYTAATKAIIKFFAQAWGTTTDVAYPDVAFKIPANKTWVRFNLQHYSGRQASIGAPGSNRFRRDGLITAQVFSVEKNAAADALLKADQIVDIFQGVSNGGITYFDVQLKEIGPDGNGWHQINVLAYFQYDRIA